MSNKTVGDWVFASSKAPILGAAAADGVAAQLGLRLPEIFFGDNSLVLSHPPSRFGISFSAQDALRRVDRTGEEPGAVRVSYSDEWKNSRTFLGVESFDSQRWDWTFSSDYAGTLAQRSPEFSPAPQGHPGIPLARLASTTDKILLYDDVSLFEDELHDNGISCLSVRVRVMPHSFFLLLRFFLRVDRVLFRIHDVRIFHDFDSNEVIRERKGLEAPYNALLEQLPPDRKDDLSMLNNMDWVARAMGMLDNSASTTSSPTQRGPSTLPSVSTYLGTNHSPTSSPTSPSTTTTTTTTTTLNTPAPTSQGVWKGLGRHLEIAYLDKN